MRLETLSIKQKSKYSIMNELKEAMNIFGLKEINKKTIRETEAKFELYKLGKYEEDKTKIDQIKF